MTDTDDYAEATDTVLTFLMDDVTREEAAYLAAMVHRLDLNQYKRLVRETEERYRNVGGTPCRDLPLEKVFAPQIYRSK